MYVIRPEVRLINIVPWGRNRWVSTKNGYTVRDDERGRYLNHEISNLVL